MSGPIFLGARFPEGKIAKKTVTDNSALKIKCHVVKNALLQTDFSAIFPLGYVKHSV